ncbi:SMI1/KNR4 family protein [Aliarcobacter butzleri]|uniref:SMI1/KNR4 family protein n=1 Tax=Aliarcobacter butzleri TaxID=28197 RepID=UPI002B248654|nr:SMI1/KNR4 family protein [Aliarcobacter butzleri]MCG3717756.1 SMI1/KNR4 family protein [Aliarcobacter butzleri]
MKKVQNYISDNRDLFILKENQTDKSISDVEDKLGFKFDSDYLEYLKRFGLICFESMEVFGIGVKENSHLNVLKNTLEIRKEEKNFPDNSVLLEYIGESNYVIYTMNKGVYQYSSNSLSLIKDNLEEYFLMRFDEVSSL